MRFLRGQGAKSDQPPLTDAVDEPISWQLTRILEHGCELPPAVAGLLGPPAPPRGKRRARVWALRAMLLVAGMLFAIAVMEIGLRFVWEPPSPAIRTFESLQPVLLPDPELPWRPRPNATGTYRLYNAEFTTNSRGLRDREYAEQAPPGVRRIVVLGDSFAWGHGVRNDEIFTEVLERELDGVEVINLGVTGFDLQSEFIWLRREGMRYAPDLVVLAVCQNDFRATGVRRPSAAPAAPAVPTLFGRMKRYFADHSYAYRACQTGINANRSVARAAVALGLKEELAGFDALDDNLHAALVDRPDAVAAVVHQWQADLLRMNEYVRAHGAILVLALTPSLQAVDPRELHRSIAYTRFEPGDLDVDRPCRETALFAGKHGIAVCDPLPEFRRLRENGERLYLPHDLHFNAAGHRRFAQGLRSIVQQTLWEGRAQPARQPE